MEQFFTDDDLQDVLGELDDVQPEIITPETNAEMEASNKRYEEIIQKYQPKQ